MFTRRQKRNCGSRVALVECFVLALVALLFVAVCGKPVLAGPKVLKIGMIVPQTGWGSGYMGLAQANKLVLDDINKAGGVTVRGEQYLFELIMRDHKSTGAGGLAAVEKLIYEDKVDFLMGTFSDTSVAAAPVANANKKIFVSTAGGKAFIRPEQPYNFSGAVVPATFPLLFIPKFAKLFPELKRVAYLAGDVGWGRETAFYFEEGIKAGGQEKVALEYYPVGTAEFGPIVNRIIARKPDLVVHNGTRVDAGLVVRTLRETGYTGRIALTTTMIPQILLKTCKKEQIQGLLDVLEPTAGPNRNPALEALMTKYEKTFGEPIDYSLIYSGTNALVLVEGIKRAQSLDSDRIKEALENIKEFDTFMGRSAFLGTKYFGSPREFHCDTKITELKGEDRYYLATVTLEEQVQLFGK